MSTRGPPIKICTHVNKAPNHFAGFLCVEALVAKPWYDLRGFGAVDRQPSFRFHQDTESIDLSALLGFEDRCCNQGRSVVIPLSLGSNSSEVEGRLVWFDGTGTNR